MSSKLPTVPPGKILVDKKWTNTPLGRELATKHSGVEFSTADSLVDFVPSPNLPVMLILADCQQSNLNVRIKKFKEAFGSKGAIVVERNASCLQIHREVQNMVTLKKDLNVLPVASAQEVPALLRDLAYVQTHPQTNQFAGATKNPLPSYPASKQLHLLTIIPNVGRKKAQLLLEKFGHLKRISYATPDEMAAVIGSSSANSVHNFFHKPVTT